MIRNTGNCLHQAEKHHHHDGEQDVEPMASGSLPLSEVERKGSGRRLSRSPTANIEHKLEEDRRVKEERQKMLLESEDPDGLPAQIPQKESFPALDEAREMLKHVIPPPDAKDLVPTGSPYPRNVLELAESKYLSTLVFGAVGLNGVQMGIQSDHSGPVLDVIFYVFDNLFTAIFLLEFLIKIAAYKCEYFKDRWNLFDFILTWISVVDMWVLLVIGGGSGIKMFAVLRIFRVFRAIRLLRMLRSFRELTLIVEGLMKALGTTSWVSILLFLLLYIFSIFCVHACGGEGIYEGYSKDTETADEVVYFNNYQYFGTILRSMFTLLQVVLLTDDWYVVSRAILERQPFILVLFLLFMAITTFGLLNVIVGIVVENVTESAKSLDSDEREAHQMELLARLEILYHFVMGLDIDGSGEIDGEEIKRAWGTPEMKELLSIVRLPVSFDSEELLSILDTDGDGVLSTDEIAKNLVRLLAGDLNSHILELQTRQNQLRKELREIHEELPRSIHDNLMKSMREEMSAQMANAVTILQEHITKCCSCCQVQAAESKHVVGGVDPDLASKAAPVMPDGESPGKLCSSEAQRILSLIQGINGEVRQLATPVTQHNQNSPSPTPSTGTPTPATDPGASAAMLDGQCHGYDHDTDRGLAHHHGHGGHSHGHGQVAVSAADSQGAPLHSNEIFPDGVDFLPHEAEFEASFGEAVRRLEFEVECGRLATPVVASVKPHGEADHRGIQKGDAILAVNGTSLTGQDRHEVLLKLRERPVVLRLCRRELQPLNPEMFVNSEDGSPGTIQQPWDSLQPFQTIKNAGQGAMLSLGRSEQRSACRDETSTGDNPYADVAFRSKSDPAAPSRVIPYEDGAGARSDQCGEGEHAVHHHHHHAKREVL